MERGRGVGPMYRFPKRLEEGLVLSRPNRFIMMVRAGGGGRTFRCHCPTTGRLGAVKVSNIPCLFSRAGSRGRKTEGTVEAISLGPTEGMRRFWIGINQSAANRYVEFFLGSGQLPLIASGEVKREVKLGSSRIDFLVGNTYVEVKTPLITLPMPEGVERVEHARFDSFDRLIRHMGELGDALEKGSRAVILLCYLYDAEPFRPPALTKQNERIIVASRRAAERGVERWQVNLKVDAGGVRLLRYFRN